MVADNIFVTPHAISRFCERIDAAASKEQALTAILLHAPCILKAAAFGAKMVKVPGVMTLALDKRTVVTVLPPRSADWRKNHQSDDKRCERRRVRSNNHRWSEEYGD